MAKLFAMARVPNPGMPNFGELPWEGYVLHGRKGEWLLFTVTTKTEAQALAIAGMDKDNLIPLGLGKTPTAEVTKEALTKINTAMSVSDVAPIPEKTCCEAALKLLKAGFRKDKDWEKELAQECAVDPEEVQAVVEEPPAEIEEKPFTEDDLVFG